MHLNYGFLQFLPVFYDVAMESVSRLPIACHLAFLNSTHTTHNA